MTVTTRDFHIGDILSVTTDRLLSPRHVEGVYDILGWMTGESLMTHQLPRAARECAPALIAQHPSLAAVTVPEGLHDRATVDAFLATLYAEHGETLPVAPLAAEDHTSMDPLAELRMMRPDLPIIVVEP
jgi:hypothetical protein